MLLKYLESKRVFSDHLAGIQHLYIHCNIHTFLLFSTAAIYSGIVANSHKIFISVSNGKREYFLFNALVYYNFWLWEVVIISLNALLIIFVSVIDCIIIIIINIIIIIIIKSVQVQPELMEETGGGLCMTWRI